MKRISLLALVLVLTLLASMALANQADVVVIGAGGAGMAAAIQAADDGATVVVLEKMNYAGGNTVRSEGGMNAAGTASQAALGIEDSPEVMIEDTMVGGKNLSNPELVRFMAENSAATVDWLTSLGMDLSEVAQGAGATNARMHRSAGGAKIGGVLTPVLMKNLEARGISILYGVRATKLDTDETGAVVGVTATDKNGAQLSFTCNSVVLATGGFGANEEQFSAYRPDLVGFSTTNHPGATGDGIVMAKEIGAALVDMDQIQTNPTVEPVTHIVLSESVRGNGAIMVNVEGKRFVCEMLTRDVLSAAILEQPEKYAYLIFDKRIMDKMEALQQDYEMGIVTEGETPEALAQELGIPEDVFAAEVESWNAAVASGNDAAFERTTGMGMLSDGPWYAIKVSPAVHYTMGGVKINTNTEVLREDDSVIANLYAAGEVTGGVHGGNRLGGNAVCDIMVFGRQAGKLAAANALGKGSLALELPQAEAQVAQVQGNYTDGVYEVEGVGRNGPMALTVTVEGGNITSITVNSHSETDVIFEAVERDFIPAIIAAQSTDVDSVAGATMSCDGLKNAIDSVLK